MIRRSLTTAATTSRNAAALPSKRWKIAPTLSYKFVRENRELCERNCRERNVDPLSVFGSSFVVFIRNVNTLLQLASEASH